jgi:hypothetical protein
MTTKLVETIKQHKYGGRTRTVGEQYEAGTAHLPILIKARWIKMVEPKPPKPPHPVMPVTPADPPTKPVRNYKRRDVTAEN